MQMFGGRGVRRARLSNRSIARSARCGSTKAPPKCRSSSLRAKRSKAREAKLMETNTDAYDLQPEGWAKPKGYANGVAADGRQCSSPARSAGTDKCVFEARRFCRPIPAGAEECCRSSCRSRREPAHVTTMTWFFIDKAAYLGTQRAVGQVWREMMGRNYPAMTVDPGRRADRGRGADRNSGAGRCPRLNREITPPAFSRA